MHWRVGFSGLALVAAFVVGGVAQQPAVPPSPWASEGTVLPPDWEPGLAVQGSPAASPKLAQVASAGEMIGFNGYDGSGSQTITLVHTGKMQIAVYHIDSSGQIVLTSSRPINDDFSLTYNATEPLPGQIRLLSSPVK